jgi:sterol 14-demethylase
MTREIPKLSGGGRVTGHLQALRHDPIGLFRRLRDECGEVGEFRMVDHPVVFLTGAEAQEAFFRAPDEVLDPAPTSNELMKPIFGEGVVYDVPPERRREMMRSPALRDKNLRGSAEIIARETERILETWGDAGEVDLLDFFAELTIYTSSACLIGQPFREALGPEFSRRYFEIEVGTDGIGYIDSGKDIEAFRVRDRARARLVEMISEVIEARRREKDAPRDLLQILIALEDGGKPRFSPSQITGILISTMFAGHHTSAGTAAWTLCELLRAPAHLEVVTKELGTIYAGGQDVSYQALREIPHLENAVKEALRLHPPLIWLPRTAQQPFAVSGYEVEPGKIVAMSSALSQRDPACFPEPDLFDPDRFAPGREEDRAHPWSYVPFGGGRHRCLGANFAMMQQKAIFSILLRRYAFELSADPASYEDNYSAMVVRPRQPFRARYRKIAA